MIEMSQDVPKWNNNRRQHGQDFFETPSKGVEALLPFIPDHVEKVWEPTAGLKAIVNVLERFDYECVSSDKYPQLDDIFQHDFLHQPFIECDAIILNPPFSFKTEFLLRLIESGKWFAMLVPLSIIETATRSKLFHEHRLSIVNLSNRLCYTGKYAKKVYFHSVWVINDGQGRIHYSELNERKA